MLNTAGDISSDNGRKQETLEPALLRVKNMTSA